MHQPISFFWLFLVFGKFKNYFEHYFWTKTIALVKIIIEHDLTQFIDKNEGKAKQFSLSANINNSVTYSQWFLFCSLSLFLDKFNDVHMLINNSFVVVQYPPFDKNGFSYFYAFVILIKSPKPLSTHEWRSITANSIEFDKIREQNLRVRNSLVDPTNNEVKSRDKMNCLDLFIHYIVRPLKIISLPHINHIIVCVAFVMGFFFYFLYFVPLSCVHWMFELTICPNDGIFEWPIVADRPIDSVCLN